MKDCVITITFKKDTVTTEFNMETKSGDKTLYTAQELMDAYALTLSARRSLRNLGAGLKDKLWELASKKLQSAENIKLEIIK